MSRGQVDDLVRVWQQALSRTVSSWDPDVVHIQHLWVIALAALNLGIRPVVTCHGSEIASLEEAPYLLEAIVARSNFQCQTLIAISKYVAGRLRRVSTSRVNAVVMPNPFDSRRFRLGARTDHHSGFRLGFAGRLVEYKRCDFFIDCVASLKDQRIVADGCIAGDGPLREALELRVLRENLAASVSFVGNLSNRCMPEFYAAIDVLVIPSDNEPFGLVSLEAAACGTPVIAADSGGLAELVRPPFIFSYVPEDLSELVGVASRVLMDRGFRGLSAERGAYVHANYSAEQYIVKLLRLYIYSLRAS
jgi:glycosyltransferase involved in cell wall biosynthesis